SSRRPCSISRPPPSLPRTDRAPLLITVRSESLNDHAGIRELNERAFGGVVEARLVDMLRAAGKTVVSLIAADQDRVVGHVAFSPVTEEAPQSLRAAGLAPMSVLPEF